MMALIGWDIGGAHLKAARLEEGRITAAIQVPCPLWLGLDQLDRALGLAAAALGAASRHAVTMTGELVDVFEDRQSGVEAIAGMLQGRLGPDILFYAGRDGWAAPQDVGRLATEIASANWHASASLAGRAHPDCLFMDIGSTTTDVVPVAGGRGAARGRTDAERLAAGELVYTGATRTFLMAVARSVPFRGAWTPLMNEYFASIADVHRVLGELPEGADQHRTADGRDKSVGASRVRLARMLGRDVSEAGDAEWTAVAAALAEMQIRTIHDAVLQVVSALPEPPPVIVGAGVGRFLIRRLCARMGRPCADFGTLVPCAPGAADAAADCGPAAAVALLLDQAAPE